MATRHGASSDYRPPFGGTCPPPGGLASFARLRAGEDAHVGESGFSLRQYDVPRQPVPIILALGRRIDTTRAGRIDNEPIHGGVNLAGTGLCGFLALSSGRVGPTLLASDDRSAGWLLSTRGPSPRMSGRGGSLSSCRRRPQLSDLRVPPDRGSAPRSVSRALRRSPRRNGVRGGPRADIMACRPTSVPPARRFGYGGGRALEDRDCCRFGR